MLQSWLTAICSAAALTSAVTASDTYDTQAQAIVDGFSAEQLLGQMTQLNLGTVMNATTHELNETAVRSFAKQYVGSYFNTHWDKPVNGRFGFNASEFRSIVQRIQEISMEENGGHPIIYGLDSVHGANYVEGSVLMPQPINSGASFNPDLVYEAARITARDTEAGGMSWIFGPILDVSQNSLWARTLETLAKIQAVQLASQHEYTIVAIGESNYAEKPGDIDDPALPEGQEKYVEALAATGTKVIVILFEGRPRLLGSIPKNAVAIINGMLPCELGGQAMAEILYGDVNPSGKLPITYPKDPANIAIPYNHRVTTRCTWDNCWMQWDFGAGLSYTKFNYSAVTLDKTNIASADDTLTATVIVTNTGKRAGKETVMLFLMQPFRKISVPEMKMLKKFKKIELQAGESMDVSFSLSTEDWGCTNRRSAAG
ncbi:Coiled-coil domain-containing protein C16orf93 [Phytophthora nicotianae]|uniref:beta-glucosidase n=1 Tax=Phytophthora nicotianae TaxID=4792 RepID=A0A0W8D6W4_PHYNI|nr:Coiled-coil domain-containing protein C16orf93 [Phytophthora nicotianae]